MTNLSDLFSQEDLYFPDWAEDWIIPDEFLDTVYDGASWTLNHSHIIFYDGERIQEVIYAESGELLGERYTDESSCYQV